MTATPPEQHSREALAELLNQALVDRNEGRFKVIAFVNRHRILAALAPPQEAERVEIPAGMKPWHGGDSAPADWDGGPVRWASPPGYVDTGEKHPEQPWRHSVKCWYDIIAYTPRPATSDPAARHPVARMDALGVTEPVDLTPPGVAGESVEVERHLKWLESIALDFDHDNEDDWAQRTRDAAAMLATLAAHPPQPSHTAEVEAMRTQAIEEAAVHIEQWFSVDGVTTVEGTGAATMLRGLAAIPSTAAGDASASIAATAIREVPGPGTDADRATAERVCHNLGMTDERELNLAFTAILTARADDLRRGEAGEGVAS